MIGRPVDDVLKGVDVETLHAGGPGRARRAGPRRHARRHLRDASRADQEPADDARRDRDRPQDGARRRPRAGGRRPAAAGARPSGSRALGLADAVRFAGYVPQQATPSWYRAADVFALSSDFDNSPNVVLEAMACGLPVVATDVGGLREYVRPPANGLLVAEGRGGSVCRRAARPC